MGGPPVDPERLRAALHAAVDAFLDALADDAAAARAVASAPPPANDAPPKPRARGGAAVRAPALPSGPVSETDRAHARQKRRQWGV